jgi:hypothetical protein
LLFQPNKCASFGSAMLKSRSSDSFTSQLKDFVAPVGINLQNCGQVIIRKQTIPDEIPNTTTFGYTKSFNTDRTTPNTFTLTDDGVKDYGKTVLFGTGYTVTEDVIPAGWAFVSVDCSASSGVTPSISTSTVTFDIKPTPMCSTVLTPINYSWGRSGSSRTAPKVVLSPSQVRYSPTTARA